MSTPRSVGSLTVQAGSLDAIRRWPSLRAREWAAQMVANLAALPGTLAIVAVGSAVRDVARSTDVDFVVIHEGPKPRLVNRPIEVDVRLYARERAEELAAQGNDYLVWAIRVGATVYDRDGYWERFREHWLDAAPWPSAVESEARAERACRYLGELSAMGDTDGALEQRISMLTHLARAKLLRAGHFPASRPELPTQLRQIAEEELADQLETALASETD